MILFSVFPIVVHSYTNLGWPFGWAISAVIFAMGVNSREAKILNRISKTILTIIFFLVIAQIMLSYDIFFMRNMNFSFPNVTRLLVIGNPNLFSRTFVIILPILLFVKEYRVKLDRFTVFLLVFNILCVTFVAASRANFVAIITFFVVLFFYQHRFIKFFNRSVVFIVGMIIVLLLMISFRPEFRLIILRPVEVVKQTYYGVTDGKVDILELGKRARIWAASLHLVKNEPLLGVGDKGDRLISDLGAIGHDKETGEEYRLAIHGGVLRVVVATGLCGLMFFLLSGLMLIRYFLNAMRQGSKMAKYGLAFIISTLVSQFGANIYAQWIFWMVLGVLAGATRIELEGVKNKGIDLEDEYRVKGTRLAEEGVYGNL
jgi:O-antigen ligase